MFELLFNYPLTVWQDARLVFDSGWPVAALVGCIGVAIVLIAVSLWARSLSVSRRVLIALLQGCVAAIALTMMWRPALLVSFSERGENTVAWVLDTSVSMAKKDVNADVTVPDNKLSRLDAGTRAIEEYALNDDTEFSAALFSLGDELTPVADLAGLKNKALSARSMFGAGLNTLLGTVNETALASIVILSDGADNGRNMDAQWWQQLASAGVPIHTVGIGQLSDPDDVELSAVTLPAIAQSDSRISARLTLRHGDKGGRARVRVTSARELIAAEDIVLPVGVDRSVHTIAFSSGNKGIQQLEFSVETQALEAGVSVVDTEPGNNRQPHIIQVVDEPKRILYMEGEPRWEYKFIRRALGGYSGVDVVSLLRTSPNKFYRQGVRDAGELAQGFPVTREQLFSYDAVIIGSLEAAELNTLQQAALRDFVSVRGGSLLMLSGRHGLADGGWGRSVVAAALPVALSSRLSAKTYTRTRSQAMPTLAGLRTPWLKLGDSDENNLDAWRGLPALADGQDVGQPKPGAVTLLQRSSTGSNSADAQPLLVSQRYGRGRSSVLGTSGTWRWQMGLPSEDERHERFWRQLLAAMVDGIVPRIAIEHSDTVTRDADTTSISVVAYNADFTQLQQSVLTVLLSRPDGSTQSVDLYPDNQQAGRYSGEMNTDIDGPYSVSATTPLNGESPSEQPRSAEGWWVRESGNAEHYDAQLHQGFLQRIADATGGSYLPVENIDKLSALLSKENAALKRENRLPLWNMPFFFLCLLLAKALEWMFRLRWKRL